MTSSPADPAPRERPADPPLRPESRRLARWALLAVVATHVALVSYFCPPRVVLGGEPFGGPDYQTHAEQVRLFLDAARTTGRGWSYDPNLLAGAPAGIWFDADSKAHELWTLCATRLGLSFATAFNLYAALIHLLVPLLAYRTARAFRLGQRAAVCAAALGSALWFFDSVLHFCWLWGMVSFAAASLLGALSYAEFARWLDGRCARTAGGRLSFLLPLGLLALTLLVHALMFGFLLVPMVWLYARSARRLRGWDHAQVGALVVGTLGANWFWLGPSLRFRHLLSSELLVGQANPGHLVADYFGLLVNPLTTGAIAPHTMLRFLALGAAALGLWRLGKAHDPRTRPLAVPLAWGMLLTYFGSTVWPTSHLEPYRFIAPTVWLAVIPAALFIEDALFRPWAARLPSVTRGVLVLLVLLLLPRAAAELGYFVPEALPDANRLPFPGGRIGGVLAMATMGAMPSPRQSGSPPDARALREWLRDNAKGGGRVLVQHWPLAEMLRWSTDLPVIGGFPDRRLPHEQADCFRVPGDPRQQGEAFAEYLGRYNVEYLVMTAPFVEVEGRRDLLDLVTRFGPHRIYRTRQPAGYVLEGQGEVAASLDRLEVTGASPELVLKFHWLDGLRCAPGCRIQREPIPGDDAGFIRVMGAPPSFVVENGG